MLVAVLSLGLTVPSMEAVWPQYEQKMTVRRRTPAARTFSVRSHQKKS